MYRFPAGVRFEYVECHPSNFTSGTWSKDFIVLHWWDEPSRRPQFDGVVSWFRNPAANVSIQYVVEAGRITQMLPESAMAWHAGNAVANRHGIGIEVNPRLSDGDYETTAVLVAEIWRRRGRKLPLRRHREFTGTNCPGTLDVARVQRRAEQIYNGATTTASTTTFTTQKEPQMSWTEPVKSLRTGKMTTVKTLLQHAHNLAAQAAENTRNLRTQVWRYSVTNLVTRERSEAIGLLQLAHLRAQRASEKADRIDAKIDALAGTLDDLLDGQGKILKAVKDADTKAIQATAAEVAAELKIVARNGKEED